MLEKLMPEENYIRSVEINGYNIWPFTSYISRDEEIDKLNRQLSGPRATPQSRKALTLSEQWPLNTAKEAVIDDFTLIAQKVTEKTGVLFDNILLVDMPGIITIDSDHNLMVDIDFATDNFFSSDEKEVVLLHEAGHARHADVRFQKSSELAKIGNLALSGEMAGQLVGFYNETPDDFALLVTEKYGSSEAFLEAIQHMHQEFKASETIYKNSDVSSYNAGAIANSFDEGTFKTFAQELGSSLGGYEPETRMAVIALHSPESIQQQLAAEKLIYEAEGIQGDDAQKLLDEKEKVLKRMPDINVAEEKEIMHANFAESKKLLEEIAGIGDNWKIFTSNIMIAQEMRADDFAIALADEPTAMATALEKYKGIADKVADTQLAQTHPNSEERIEHAKKQGEICQAGACIREAMDSIDIDTDVNDLKPRTEKSSGRVI